MRWYLIHLSMRSGIPLSELETRYSDRDIATVELILDEIADAIKPKREVGVPVYH